jgi:SAM-dependent methyltransferase
MNSDSIRSRVQQYYDDRIQAHGPTAQGVDWNSLESQQLRFKKLLALVDRGSPFSINDFGCGYGALADYLEPALPPSQYFGFDLSARMIDAATKLHASKSWATFVRDESELPAADYTVASGIFNVKLDTPVAAWEGYILETLQTISRLSRKGFAFNVLTKYADAEFMRPDLYYADPLFLFDYCKKNFSRFVALLHDYPLYEFTMLVRRVE